jgi:acetyl esterase/lipase
MSFEGFFVGMAVFCCLTALTAVVKARAIGWLVPFYFLLGWLTSELAAWGLFLQILFYAASVLVFGVDGGNLWLGTLLFVASWLMLLTALRRGFDSGSAFEHALRVGLGEDFRDTIPPARRARLTIQIHSDEWFKPFAFSRPGARVARNISYGGAGKRNLLDVFTPVTEGSGRPVLLQVHGGAWILGHKGEQGQPLLHRMAELGWVGVAINYRLAPKDAWPAQIIDVKRAIAWIRENIADYGGDPNFIAVTGGSAGGHMTLLSALTPGFEDWQPGFEGADTRVQAALALYPAVDFTNRHGIRQRNSMDSFISKKVVQREREGNEQLYHDGSPVDWIHRDGVAAAAPPLCVVQGTHDTMIWVEEARQFVAELAPEASHPLVYAELPGAQHAFEFFHSPRTSHYLNAASVWLEWAYARWRDEQSS